MRPGYGNFLTGKRIEKGLTVKQLSEKAGIPERNISNIEFEKKGWSWHDLDRYRKCLDIPLSEVVYD